MNDVQEYVAGYLGRFTVQDVIRNRRPLEFHRGNTQDTLVSLKARGFDRVVRMAIPRMSFNLFLAQSSASGEVRWAVSSVAVLEAVRPHWA